MAAKPKKEKEVRKMRITAQDVGSPTRDSALGVGGPVRVLLPSDPATHDTGKVQFGGFVTRKPREE